MKKNNNTNRQNKATIIYIIIAILVMFIWVVTLFPNIDLDVKDPIKSEQYAVLETDSTRADLEEIFDDSPLFIPTNWNAKSNPNDIKKPEGWDTKIKENQKIATPIFTADFLINVDADLEHGRSELSQSFRRSIFSSYQFNEGSTKHELLNSDITFTLVDLSTGKKVKTASLVYITKEEIYSIAEFKITIGSDDWALPPLKIHSSGDDKVDDYLQGNLTTSALLKGIKQGDYKATFTP